jgi:hypothetical protein
MVENDAPQVTSASAAKNEMPAWDDTQPSDVTVRGRCCKSRIAQARVFDSALSEPRAGRTSCLCRARAESRSAALLLVVRCASDAAVWGSSLLGRAALSVRSGRARPALVPPILTEDIVATGAAGDDPVRGRNDYTRCVASLVEAHPNMCRDVAEHAQPPSSSKSAGSDTRPASTVSSSSAASTGPAPRPPGRPERDRLRHRSLRETLR